MYAHRFKSSARPAFKPPSPFSGQRQVIKATQLNLENECPKCGALKNERCVVSVNTPYPREMKSTHKERN